MKLVRRLTCTPPYEMRQTPWRKASEATERHRRLRLRCAVLQNLVANVRAVEELGPVFEWSLTGEIYNAIY